MNFPRMQLTSAGIRAIINAVYDESVTDPIIFTCVKLGSGTYSGSVKAKTDLTHTEKTIEFTGITVADGIATLTFLFNNVNIDTGFYLRELGIFAKVGEGGTQFLFAYSNAGDTAAYIKPYQQDSNVNMTVSVAVAVGDAENVEAIISGSVGYVTQTAFDDHLADYDNPHHVTAEKIGLGNVPNLAPSDMTVTFTEASSVTTLTPGSTLSTLFGQLARLVTNLTSHLTASNNPHNVTAEQIGIDSSYSVPVAEQTINFTPPASITAISVTDNLQTILGKLSRAVSSLISHLANKSNPHSVTYSQIGAAAAGHTHTYTDVGAAAAGHTHTAAQVGAAPTNHAHTKSQITDLQIATIADTLAYLGIN